MWVFQAEIAPWWSALVCAGHGGTRLPSQAVLRNQQLMLCFPSSQFDYKAIADRLVEVTSKKNIPPFNRKRLCKLIRK